MNNNISIKYISISLITLILSNKFTNYFSQDTTILITSDYSKKRPPLEGRPGFFLDDWEEKRNPKTTYSKTTLICENEATVSSIIDFSKPLVKISKYIYGNNLGHWSNRKILGNDDFIFYLKDISVPVIRFPGGNASNDYFWDASSVDQCP